jgi:hypothetical protein
MREIKIRAPSGKGQQVAQIALDCGAPSVAIHQAWDAKSSEKIEEVKIKTSTPAAHLLIKALQKAAFYVPGQYTISSHDLRALWSGGDVVALTRPFCMPALDVYEDLWQSSHITASFIVRVAASALLVSYGMLRGQIILTIGGMLFTIFSPPLMATGLGISMRDGRLVGQALRAFLLANLLSILAAAAVAGITGGPIKGDDFGSLPSNLFISITAAAAGAIADTDDSGRRQLIAIAAAFPYSRFPPWIGMCCVLGFPDAHTTLYRISVFAANIAAMVLTSALTYRLLRLRPIRQ